MSGADVGHAAVLERIARDPGHGGGLLGEDEIAAALRGAEALRTVGTIREALAGHRVALRLVLARFRRWAPNRRDEFAEDAAAERAAVAALALPVPTPGAENYQARVNAWMLACFGEAITADRTERSHRFLEEALELVQASGCTASEAHQLVDYVFGRDTGEVGQEVGGVMVCLAALCTTHDLDMVEAAETELRRVWTKVEKIRAKHAAKPQFSPLPGATP